MTDKPILNQHEIDILRECEGGSGVQERFWSMPANEREAYVDGRIAAIRSVVDRGFVETGAMPKLTDAGRAALELAKEPQG